MTQDSQSQSSQDGTAVTDPDELREQVERTRAELGDTVEALAAKADVKARAKDRAVQVKEQATVKADALRTQTTATVGALRTRVSGLAQQAQDRLSGPDGAPGSRAVRDRRAVAVVAASTGALVLWLTLRRRKK
ncbi:DUF3618 domain-containing protein [Streptomyces sp. NPDC088785]|uniref:DUF3618 domain-containing protein n=1 Tax=Streptomyces sp. NPDC088785 TaxID=3365897 RepID=UPI0038134834